MKKSELKKIIEKELDVEDGKVVKEAYVAQQKKFDQVTDSLSKEAKSTHERIYSNHIKSFNRISAEMDAVSRDDIANSLLRYRAQKKLETDEMNAVYLHELHFANVADMNSEIMMESLSYIRLQRDWGDFYEWQKDFVACAMASDNGWAVAGYNIFLKRYHNFFISDNSCNVPVGIIPIIVIDMHEHAYTKDYSDDRYSYVISQLKELRWDVIESRVRRVEAIQ